MVFYGVNNEGVIVGLENQQVDTDFISEMTKARLALYQKYSLYRLSTKGISLLSYELKRIHILEFTAYPNGYQQTFSLLLPILLVNKSSRNETINI